MEEKSVKIVEQIYMSSPLNSHVEKTVMVNNDSATKANQKESSTTIIPCGACSYTPLLVSNKLSRGGGKE